MNKDTTLVSTDFVERLQRLRQPCMFSHRKPDGDALGALVGLRQLLADRGCAPQSFIYEPLSPRYATIPEFAAIPIWTGGSSLPADCDGIVILDTCSYSQLEPIEELLRGATVPRLVVDHHQSHDELADAYWIDPGAAATCLMIIELAHRCGWRISPFAANAIFVGLATDTGWFRHSNTDARAHRAAADLLTCGAEAATLFDRLYLRDSPARVRLLGEALQSLQWLAADRLAVMVLDGAAFQRCGASLADTEDLVNEPLRVASVVVSVLFVQQPDGIVRANFRSKPPQEGLFPDIDVAAAAAHFGGGGHRRAAGARFSIPLADAVQTVTAYLLRLLPS